MPKRTTLDVSLTPELVGPVAARVASGRYGSASEVVRAALRALERQEAADAPRSFDVEARETQTA